MTKYYLLLAISCILWGIQPVAIKIIVAEMDPVIMIPIRYVLLASIFFIIMKIKGEKRFFPLKSCIFTLFIMGFWGITISNGAQFLGLRYSSATNAALIGSTAPAITALLATIFTKERLNSLQWLGIIISFSGALFLISNGSLEMILNISFNFGDILFLLGELGWSIYCLISVPIMKKMSVISVTAWTGLFGALQTAVYGQCTSGLFIPQLSTIALISFVFIVFGGGVTAMICWNSGIKYVGASTSCIFLNLLPVVGIITATVTINEPLTMIKIISAIIILSGVYITTQSNHILTIFQKKYSIKNSNF